MATFNGTSVKDKIYGTNLDDTINGLGGDDTLYGLDGDDTIDGGTGADTMSGGIGNDKYYVDNINDQVIELKGDSNADEVHTVIDYTLPDHVEILYLEASAGAINGTGNAIDNSIFGNSSRNTLKGMDGNDYLDGGGDADRMEGGKGTIPSWSTMAATAWSRIRAQARASTRSAVMSTTPCMPTSRTCTS